MWARLTLISLLLVGGGDTNPLSISATPEQSYAPTTITLKIKVTPHHRDDIQLCFGFTSESDSAESRTSCQPMSGQYDFSNYLITYTNIPAGQYEAFAQLYRAPSYLAYTVKSNFVVIADER